MSANGRHDVYLGLGVVVLALVANFWLIPAGVNPPPKVPYKALHPAFWPNIIMWFMCAMGAVLIFQGMRASGRQEAAAEPQGRHTGKRWLTVAAALGALFVYLWLLHYVGFVAASAIALPVFMLMMGESRWFVLLPLAVLLPLCLHLFFKHVASVYVPLGFLEGLLG